MEQIQEITGEKLETVKNVLRDFLNTNGHKVTSERLTILETIYGMDAHFDAVELYHQMRNQKHSISLATIYNNLSLYVEAGLINKHRFGKGMAQYERCYFRGDHHHIIFTDTGEVKEFNDPRIDCIKATIEEEFGIKVARHSLHFYGERCKRGNNFSSGQAKAFVKNSRVS